LQVDKLNMEK